jgi:hypothetical protein
MYRKGKGIRNKKNLAALVFVPCVFEDKFLTDEN